jgi:hypothetical protein
MIQLGEVVKVCGDLGKSFGPRSLLLFLIKLVQVGL